MYYQNQSQIIQVVHKQGTPLLVFQRINSPTFRMANWQTCVGGTMTFDIRKIRTAKCSTYWIDQSLEFSCICYQKEVSKMENEKKNKN